LSPGRRTNRNTLSFPMPALGAPKRGCQLPDAIFHGKWNLRPDSATVQRLAALIFERGLLARLDGRLRVRLRTRPRHACDFASRLGRFAPGQGRDWRHMPRGHGSGLLSLRLLLITIQRCVLTSPVFWKGFTMPLPGRGFPPRRECSFCPAFRRLSGADFVAEAAGAPPPY